MPDRKTFRKIKKRNGRLYKFRESKIERAISAAGQVTGEFDEKVAQKLTTDVVTYLVKCVSSPHSPTVEQVQDAVERVLLESEFYDTAKEYILFRAERERVRQMSSKFNKGLIDKYLKRADWQVKENSNMGFSLSGLNNYMASELSKTYWLSEVYPKEIRDSHTKGDLHIHDLNSLCTYCMGWDLYDLLVEGFKGVPGKVVSSPAKHFRTALGHMVNFIYTLQNEASGAQAFSSVDTLLAPFIRYDKLSYKEVKQAMQEFIFNMNVSTRQGGQTPFSNITLDLEPSPNFKDKAIIIGGKTQKETYSDFQKEMDWFNRAFCEVMLEGDADSRVFTFPIPTYNITKEFNWDNPNLDILWEATAKYGIPYFANYINSDMKPSDALSMCCRLKLDLKQLNKRGGGLFGASSLTGSVGVVTINLPRLARNSDNGTDFMRNLGKLMDLAKESLEIKRKTLEDFIEGGLYPYTMFYLRKTKERFSHYWTNHFSTIGLVGMNEACVNLLNEDIGTKRGSKFAQKVLKYMRKRLLKYQDSTGNNYNLEATPAEGTAYRLALKDKKSDNGIICANEEAYKDGAEPYYTNSSNLPVSYTTDLFEALDHQDKLQPLYTGGTVFHTFLGEAIDDPNMAKILIKKMCESYNIPYFSLTPTFSICPVHGYLSGEHKYCPKCDDNILENLNKKET